MGDGRAWGEGYRPWVLSVWKRCGEWGLIAPNRFDPRALERSPLQLVGERREVGEEGN